MSLVNKTPDTQRSAQRGGILILGMLLIVVVIFLGLLVIDVARLERSAASLQRVADAAALASAEFLKRGPQPNTNHLLVPRSENWLQAKRAALHLITESANTVYGATSRREVGGDGYPERSECGGDLDIPGDKNLRCRRFDFGDVVVTIERGYAFREAFREAFRDENENGTIAEVYGDSLFTSLEGSFVPVPTSWDTKSFKIPDQCKGSTADGATPRIDPTWLANGVRVRVSIVALPLTMGALLRVFTGPVLTREAIASVDMPTTRGVTVASATCF